MPRAKERRNRDRGKQLHSARRSWSSGGRRLEELLKQGAVK